MKKLLIYSIPLFLFVASGCYKTITKMENSKNEVVLSYPEVPQFNAASSGLNFWNDALISPDLGKAEDTLLFSLNIPHELNKSVTVHIGINKEAVAAYNKDTLFGAAYELLPDSVYSIVSPEITIPAGKTDTTFEVAIVPSDIDISETGYLLPVSITSANGIAVSAMHTAYIHIEKDPFPPYSRADWEAVDWDSQEESGEGPNNGRVWNLFDNDNGTYWHTEWQNAQPGLPHWFVIDMHATHTLHGFETLDRQGVGSQGRPKNVKFEVSTDGSTWITAGEFTMEDQNGSWQKVAFDTPLEDVQYLKFTVNSTYGGSYYTNMAEFKVY